MKFKKFFWYVAITILPVCFTTSACSQTISFGQRSQRDREVLTKYPFRMVYGAFAFNQNDISVCDDSPDAKECLSRVKFYNLMKNLATGNCGALETGMRPLCEGLKTSCNNISDNPCLKKMCDAFRNGNREGLWEASRMTYWVFDLDHSPMDYEEATFNSALYNGFTKGTIASCSDVFNNSQSLEKAVCKVLFSSKMKKAEFSVLLDSLIQQYSNK